MKKHITLALGLAVLSGSAFATKARLEALGESAGGSQFISDNRNVFLNAATVNYHKDFVTFEWGDTTNRDDAPSSPRGEGGVIKSAGNMVYGLYLGNESDTSNNLRTMAMGANAVLEQNNVDLFIGGDAGVQWGASLTYSKSKGKYDSTAGTVSETPEQSLMRANLGVISGDVEAYANVGISNKAENGTDEFNGKSSFDVGATYNMSDVALMARVQSIQAEDESKKEYKTQVARVGAAKTYKLNDKATMWMNAWYVSSNTSNEISTGSKVDTKIAYLPVGIALEVMAKEWLALRGSVTQNVLMGDADVEGDKGTVPDTTTVAAGASLIFGDLSVDGMIGNNSSTGVAGDDTSANATLRSDTLMSRVSMTYRF